MRFLARTGILLVVATLAACALSVEGLPTGSNAGGTASNGGATSSAASGDTSAGGAGGNAAGTGGGAGCPAGFQCVAAASAGEYVRMASGKDLACPAGWTDPLNYADGVDPGCSACACDPPTGGSCMPGSVNGSAQADCSPFLGLLTFAAGSCQNFMATANGFVLYQSTPSAAACGPGASAP